jgi:hypothetical protein
MTNEERIIREISTANFPFEEIHKNISLKSKYKDKWGYKNPKFYKDKAYRFEYNFEIDNIQYHGYVYMGIDIIDEFIIIITDYDNNILHRYDNIYVFWIEDKIDYFLRNINNFKLKKYGEIN